MSNEQGLASEGRNIFLKKHILQDQIFSSF